MSKVNLAVLQITVFDFVVFLLLLQSFKVFLCACITQNYFEFQWKINTIFSL